MKMCGTASNMAHKSYFHAEFTLRILLSLFGDFQFRVSLFGGLYLPIQTELVQAPINKVVVLTSIFNFVNYAMNQIATVWEL